MTFATFNATEILPKTRVALFAHVRLCLYTLLIFVYIPPSVHVWLLLCCVQWSKVCVSVFLCSTVSRNLCVFFLAQQQQRVAGEARPRQQQFTAGRRRKAAAKERLQVCKARIGAFHWSWNNLSFNLHKSEVSECSRTWLDLLLAFWLLFVINVLAAVVSMCVTNCV